MNTDPKQPAGKYMDVTHPAHVRPSATSRPIIVGSRPMLAADPMIAELAQQAATHKNDENSQTDDVAAHSRDKVVKPPTTPENIAPTAPKNPEEDDEPAKPDSALDTASAQSEPETGSKTSSDETQASDRPESKPTVAEISHTDSEKSAEASAEKAHISLSTTEETPPVSAAAVLDTASDATESDTPSPEDEAAAHAEQIITDGTYFLPIGQAKHRGQRLIFGICLIVVLSLVVVDVLLDTGIISLSSVPHTTFFGS